MTKLEITVADITGNYMPWSVSVKMDLRGNGHLETINKLKTMSYEKNEKDMMFLRNYIHDGLNDKYITKEDHVDILQCSKERFDHKRYVNLYRNPNTSRSNFCSRTTKY